jgi:hypothetical protein
LSLCFNWAPRHRGVCGEWMYSSTHSLTSAPDGGEWSASHTSRFTPRDRAPGTHWIGGWLGPRAVLDAVVKRKIPNLRRESNPRTPIVHPVAQRKWKLQQWRSTHSARRKCGSTSTLKDALQYTAYHIKLRTHWPTNSDSWMSVFVSLKVRRGVCFCKVTSGLVKALRLLSPSYWSGYEP